MFGGVSIPRADHCWLLLSSMAEWVLVVIWCDDRWSCQLERKRVDCLLLAVLCFTLGGVGVSGGIICTLLSDWLGGGGVMLSWSGVAALMGGTFGVTVMGGIVTLGNNGATLGGETGSCFDAFEGN